MDRGASYRLLSWMMLPVCAVLVLSALSLARQPYTGLMLRGDWVAAVDPGSPGERAGLRRGDRLIEPGSVLTGHLQDHPLASAHPGDRLDFLRERERRLTEITLEPVQLPEGERRMMAMLLAVASGFVVLGGWVWSERRDRLTRTFYLVCLAFACLLAPIPHWDSIPAHAIYDALYTAVTLLLPALFVHFFALFPESNRPSGARGSVGRIAYGVAGALTVASVVLPLYAWATHRSADTAIALLQGVAGLWFAACLLVALLLFVRSYAQVRAADARRRLRVALIGTIVGAGPLAALVALRNLFPGTPVAGERAAVVLTLLVPGSFAWATAVHRIFEFRVAMRAAAAMAALALIGAAVYFAGEWLGAAWRADLGNGIAGGALAFVAVIASVAGPARGLVRRLGQRMIPDPDQATLAEWLMHSPAGRRGSLNEILAAACEGVTSRLKLDGCVVLELTASGAVCRARAGDTAVPALGDGFGAALSGMQGALAVADAAALGADRAALETAGVCWVMPLGGESPRAALLLGRRLAGAWLGLSELRDLEQFAEQLEVLIENVTLREAASAHGALDRELTRAGAIQAHLQPRKLPSHPTLDCAACALSSEAVGGDYYDCVESSAGHFMLAVGDAAGKGVPGALMSAWVQACFRTQARRGARPGRVLGVLNHELVALEQPDAFVALLCAQVDVRGARLRFANAGLTPPILRRRDGSVSELTDGGVLLGVAPHADYMDTGLELEAGDMVVLYTDGLTEARRGDEMFGAEGIEAVLERHADRPAAEIVRELMAAARAFSSHEPDDMTVVVLKQMAAPSRSRRAAPEDALKWKARPADALG